MKTFNTKLGHKRKEIYELADINEVLCMTDQKNRRMKKRVGKRHRR